MVCNKEGQEGWTLFKKETFKAQEQTYVWYE